jgi:D-arabinose 1-dehydrogenase-like Zn-dependent alcohol dehydrogenase
MARAADLITQNKVIPLLNKEIYKLADANKAYELLTTGANPGKVGVSIA